MANSGDLNRDDFVLQKDYDFISTVTDDDLREAMVCSVTTYRKPNKLAKGDKVPALRLPRLDGSGEVDLGAAANRPVLLLFGSYT